MAECPVCSKCSMNGCFPFVTKARFAKRLHIPPWAARADSAATWGPCCNCPAPLPPHSQLRLGVYSSSCIPSRALSPTPSANHATWPHSPPPTQGAWPCSSLTAHAGLTHARLATRQAGPCAAMARCPLPGTGGPVHGLADGSKVGARREVRVPAGAGGEGLGGGISRGREGGLAGRPEMWSWLVFVERTPTLRFLAGFSPRPGLTQAQS